ncbi:hypothetical protein [Nereida sp. MMG025]|uniref:hypothetical protein n=1 Tax=Nereida sp. MMG025 TaxID=2909981 RepID=UPI001F240F05|nr:hypothetical protein [Nereida sp. MMG025]MCF6444385.1 hypothetical protein [Nereida sp. MMG025]
MIATPDFKTFLKRSVLGALLLAAALLPLLTAIDLVGGLIVTAVSPIVYMIAFDDWRTWRRTREQVWTLDAQGLTLTDGSEEPNLMPWAAITTAQEHWWDGVVVSLKDGQRLKLNYLANPKAVAQRIRQATQ